MKKLKNALVTWGMAYGLITGLLYALNEWLNAYPVYVRTLILSGLMVFALQYVLFPSLEYIKNNKNR